MRSSYHTEQWLPYPVERVFDFFANPNNLPLLMPPWQKSRIEKLSILPPPNRTVSSNSIATAAGEGTQLTLSFRPFPFSPVRIRWESEITEFSGNNCFCDRQIRGPFTYWKHSHTVRPASWRGVNVTLVADDIEYEVPFGVAGTLANRLFLRGQIKRTFAYRQTHLEEALASVMWQSPESQPDRAAAS